MEDLFNKDITIINKYCDKETMKPKYKVSYVKGFWSSNQGISINDTQLTKRDGLTAIILINDSRNETYQKPDEFKKAILLISVNDLNNMSVRYANEIQTKKLANPNQVHKKTWTLQTGDYLVKGKVENFTTITQLLEDYQDVMKITNISTNDNGSEDMWNFEIIGA